MRDIYQVQIDIIIYKIYQLVGAFSAKFVSSRISQNIFFHMIGGGGAFPKLVFTFNIVISIPTTIIIIIT